MKWREHVEEWKDCQVCQLGCQRDRIVLARGTLPADVLFIGEAPGDSEDALGRPFVGPAGVELDRWVSNAVHSDELRIAFSNLVACFPRTAKRRGDNEPEPAEIKACAPRLNQLIEIARPRLIVCVGGLAEKWLPKLPLSAAKDVKRIAIVHPAAVIRANMAQRGLMARRAVLILSTAFEELAEGAVE